MPEAGWLKAFLDGASKAQLCTRVYCTTCGAKPFRDGLKAGAIIASGTTGNEPLAKFTADALATLGQETVDHHSEALRLTLVELWGSLGEVQFHRIVEAKLANSPMAIFLQRMRAHSADRARAYQTHEDSQRRATQQREFKKAERTKAHVARLEAKKLRDAEWRARSSEGSQGS